jgi:subtilase family serine protease
MDRADRGYLYLRMHAFLGHCAKGNMFNSMRTFEQGNGRGLSRFPDGSLFGCKLKRWSPRPLLAGLLLLVMPGLAASQGSAVRSLVTQGVDETKLVALRGNTHPLARAEFDRGAAPASLAMDHMLLVLKRSPEQEAALETLLAQQQDKTSPNYHKWLTPEQFGQQFGPSDQDIQTITSWLQSHGFQNVNVSNGRTTIDFSGTAGQVEEAFHTSIHKYVLAGGEEHWANAGDPQIPSALNVVVAGVNSLNNFPKKPSHHSKGVVRKSTAAGQDTRVRPEFTFGPYEYGCNGFGFDPNCYGIGPGDFATIYNVPSTINGSVAGTGQNIAIVSDSDIYPSDVTEFRSLFGLPPISFNQIETGTDPGAIFDNGDGDEVEAVIDVEWSGAVAPGATINLVVSPSTNTSFGGDISAQYVINCQSPGPGCPAGAVPASILSYSYGECELFLGPAGNQFYYNEWQQASAEGITVLVATGDTGSAGCDSNTETVNPAEYGLEVNGIASTPYNVAVGGTDFNDFENPSTYFSSSVGIVNSALGYVPETASNNTCANPVLANGLEEPTPEAACNNGDIQSYGFVNVSGGGGGVSNCTLPDGPSPSNCSGGWAKPSWQVAPGVPPDGLRDLPDVSLFAGNGTIQNFYVVCESDLAAYYAGTTPVPCSLAYPYDDFVIEGGTSFAVQAFAGVVALMNQKQGDRQGNLNPLLYSLAAGPSASNIFHDVTSGTNAMPCIVEPGVTGCVINVSGDTIGVLSGYNAGPGYDQATGLGSVNIGNLVSNSVPQLQVTTTSASFSTGTVGTGYALVTLAATGGFPPYTWNIISGALPAGLALNSAAISGTPTASGTFSFTVQVTDSVGNTATAGLSITVNAAPAPAITGLSPSSATAGSPGFTLTVNGTGFVNGATVNVNGGARVTTFVSGTQVTAAILASDIATAGTFSVTVTNPAPEGGTSGPVNFTVNNPVPAIASVSPLNAVEGGAAFTLTVNGTGFVPTSVVNFNFSPRTTTFLSGTQVSVTILATDIATTGTFSVTVTNPAPGGGTSAATTFTVIYPVPAITTISPASATAGTAAFTLTVSGVNFVPTSVVSFNGNPRTTGFVSGTQLLVSILSADIATGGSFPVTVINPAPGGGISGAAIFTVNNPVPAIASISPPNGMAGGAAFTLTVNGTGFVSTSVVNFNSSPRATTFVSGTQVTAAILATDIATTGLQSVTVTNPSPGGGTSTAATFASMGGPIPTITSLSPSSETINSPLNVMVNGTKFVSGATVNFNGSPRTTSFVSAAQLTAVINPADIASVGWDEITVTNPGLEVSNAVAFAVNGGSSTPIMGSALRFVPITPCRLVDTRNTPDGAFAGPSITGGTSRNFTIPLDPACTIPSTAAAYSLNIAVIPAGPLGYVTLWPTGQTQPLAATLSSVDGRVRSNAAIVPAGTSGAVSVFASNTTDLVMDIDGYFTTATSALEFYPVTPCRVVDTRPANGPTGPLAGPSLSGNTSRSFPLTTGSCNLPSTAQAYSLNLTAVPQVPLGYLTAWPTGQTQPGTANLSAPTGTVTSNAAIVPAGTSGSIDVYASNTTDLVIDVDGYFAPAGTGGLSLYNLPPCRVLDTRQVSDTQTSQPFTGELDENIQAGACGVPVGAQAYVLNATVVPSMPLGYLTLWPQGSTQPLAATLSALDETVTSNLAIVPTTNGSISTYAANPTQLVLDIFGYFGP